MLFSTLSVVQGLGRRLRERGDQGQATAEYALVILGASAMALLVISWAASTGAVGDLLDRVFNSISSRVA